MAEIEADEEQTGYEHQAAYIFTPSDAPSEQPPASRASVRPAKRRKGARKSLPGPCERNHDEIYFQPLLDGKEPTECVQLRQKLYEESWSFIDQHIQDIISASNEMMLNAVADFIEQLPSLEHDDQIQTGLVVTGPNIGSQELLFTQLHAYLLKKNAGVVITLRSGDAPNLKTVLKKLIREATHQQASDDDEDTSFGINGRNLLNYDLEMLYSYVQTKANNRVVVTFQDSEAFDCTVLSELVKLFSSWLDRIQFTILFGIATSVELFQERLPRSVVRLLRGNQFDVEQTSTTISKIFDVVVANNDAVLKFRSPFLDPLFIRQEQHAQSLQSFILSLKYAYMQHFYANPLSILLATRTQHPEPITLLISEHFEFCRSTWSFQNYVGELLNEGQVAEAKALVNSDKHLGSFLAKLLGPAGYGKESPLRIRSTRESYRLELLRSLAERTGIELPSKQDLYLSLNGSTTFSELTDPVKDALQLVDSERLAVLLDTIISEMDSQPKVIKLEEHKYHSKLLELQRRLVAIQGIQQSKHAKQKQASRILRTTVINQRIRLQSSSSSDLDEDDSPAGAYTALLDEVGYTLNEYFLAADMMGTVFQEINTVGSPYPFAAIFTPRPRNAIETALSDPQYYLGCDCCNARIEGLQSTHPATAVLYQLYLESGVLINVCDLWSAFYAVIDGNANTGKGTENEEDGERMALALFYRAVAELKMLGLLKPSRKKVDCVAKTAWKGL